METKWGPLKLSPFKAKFDIVKWEYGKPPEVAVGTVSAAITPTLLKVQGVGASAFVQVKGEGGIQFSPDLAEFTKWFGRGLVTVLASETAIVVGLAGGAFVLFAVGLYDLSKGSEAGDAAEAWASSCLNYVRGFQAGLRNQDTPKAVNGSRILVSGPARGAMDGRLALKKRARETGIPEQTLVDEYRKRNISQEVWKQK